MKICFPSITYVEHPFIWDYNQEANKAECTLKLAGTPVTYEKSVLLDYLRKFSGITINSEGTAVIDDMKAFLKLHPMTLIHELSDVKKLSPSSPVFFKHSVMTTATTTEDSVKGIRVEAFINIKRWPTEWGNTLSCLEYFSKKSSDDARSRRMDFIQSERDLTKNLQYLENGSLYLVKQNQMKIICFLFNDILAPLYDELQKDEEVLPPNFSAYLRNMVERTMLNKRLNYGLTPTEQLSREEREEKFIDTEEFEFAVQQDCIARANIMLRGLLFFISPEMKTQKLTKDKDVAERLDLIRNKLDMEAQMIFSQKLNILRDLTIEAGQIEYKFDMLMKKLTEQISNKVVCIGTAYSCYSLIHQSFADKLQKEKDSVITSLAADTIDLIIHAIRETYQNKLNQTQDYIKAQGHIGQLLTCDKDFYFSKAMAESLSVELNEALTHVKKKNDLPPIAKDFIMRFIEKHLNQMQDDVVYKHEAEDLTNTTFVI